MRLINENDVNSCMGSILFYVTESPRLKGVTASGNSSGDNTIYFIYKSF